MSGEKTEQPTDKRLRESREKGDIAKSTEVVSAAGVIGAISYFMIFGQEVFGKIMSVSDYIFLNSAQKPFEEALITNGQLITNMAIGIVLPFVAIVLSCVLAALIIQTGFLIAPKAAIPKLSNLNPQKWFKKVFSVKNVFEFVKNILKVLVLSCAVYIAVKNNFRDLFKLLNADIANVWIVSANILKTIFLYTIGTFSVIAAIDFLYTRFKYTKDHMMTKDEVKREYKESEGDPLIKSKRKQFHRELLNQNKINKTRKAKVLIVNPTHYAVAIDYDPKTQKFPTILAKGEGDLAKRMIAIAKEENIPIMRVPPLARSLFAEGEEDQYVPNDLLMQVAEVLKFVQDLQNKS